MSLRIQTNAAAINAHRQLSSSDNAMSKSLEKLSSGYRINRAADDAAGLSMSSKFTAQIRGMNVASRNASQANSLLQIAEGGMDQVSNILSRLKELAVQAASANTSTSNKSDINTEATQLLAEVDRIANSTTFQGTSLLTGFGTKTTTKTLTASDSGYGLDISGAAAHTFSVSATSASGSEVLTIKDTTTSASQSITVSGGAQTLNFNTLGISFKASDGAIATALGAQVAAALTGMVVTSTNADFQIGETNGGNYKISFSLTAVDQAGLAISAVALGTAANAQSSMDLIDTAIGTLATARASIGAIMNRLDYTSANLATAIENASAANSVIKDVDMASEMTSFTKNQILVQAGTAMLAQANSSAQTVLSLFK